MSRCFARFAWLIIWACCAGAGWPSDAVAQPPVAANVVVAAPDTVTDAPPRDYLAEARAGFTAQNRAFQRTRVLLSLLDPFVTIGLSMLLLATGLAARFRDIARSLGHRRYIQVLVTTTCFAVAMGALQFPWTWFRDFALEHQYGLSTQSFGGWLGDQLKGLLVAIVGFGVLPVLALGYAAVARFPRGWWLWLAGGAVPLLLLATLLQPLVVDPLFNRFTTLREPDLRAKILALGARAGIPARNVYEVDMSSKTTRVNAYVSGWGASQRIVLWDTTLQKMSEEEILFVMGHEMGHYVLGHLWKYVGMAAVGAFALFGAGYLLVTAALRRFGPTWGVDGAADVASMPLFAAMLTLVLFVAQPGLHALSRIMEHESDIYALEITRDNDAAARAFLKLAEENRSDPEPPAWVKFMLATHPPLGERIQFAMAYRPWDVGAPNRFFRGAPSVPRE